MLHFPGYSQKCTLPEKQNGPYWMNTDALILVPPLTLVAGRAQPSQVVPPCQAHTTLLGPDMRHFLTHSQEEAALLVQNPRGV